MLFFSPTPEKELYNLMRRKNPQLIAADSDMTLSAVKSDIVDEYDTFDASAQLVINSSSYKGTLHIDFRRIDLATFFNLFNDVERIPTIKLNTVPNHTVQLYSIIELINRKLGTAFNRNANCLDLVDQSIAIPDLNQSVQITLVAADTSALAKSGSSFKINLVCAGSLVDDAIANHNLMPWTVNAKTVPQYAIRNLNFTDPLADVVSYHVSNGVITLTADAMAKIIAMLTEINVPLPSISGSLVTGVTEITTSAAAMTYVVKPTSAYPNDINVNKTYSHFIIIPATLGGQLPTATSLAGDYYLHFNNNGPVDPLQA